MKELSASFAMRKYDVALKTLRALEQDYGKLLRKEGNLGVSIKLVGFSGISSDLVKTETGALIENYIEHIMQRLIDLQLAAVEDALAMCESDLVRIQNEINEAKRAIGARNG